MERKVKYKVWYGSNTSYQRCYNLRDVFDFVSYCLREGTKITGIEKVEWS